MVSYRSERFQSVQVHNELKVKLKTDGRTAKDGKSLKMSVKIISHARTVYFLLFRGQTYYNIKGRLNGVGVRSVHSS